MNPKLVFGCCFKFSQGGAGGGGGLSRPKNRLSRISVLVEKRELLLSIAR